MTRHRLMILALTLLAFGLQLTNLGPQSLLVDQGITYARAAVPWEAAVFHLLLVAKQTPLYYELLRLWLRAAGFSSFAFRFPSVWARPSPYLSSTLRASVLAVEKPAWW